MTGWRNIPLKRAERYAEQFVRLIQLDCMAVAVAGEVRRKQSVTSSPIEVVAVPLVIQEHNLFDEPLPMVSALDETLKRLIGTDRLEERIERRRGKRELNEYPTKLLFRADSGMLCQVDLWKTTTRRYGAVLALRTGPYGLRSGLVTPDRSISSSGRAGLLPTSMQLSERTGLVDRETGEELDASTESKFWDIVGQRMLPPEERR